MKKFYTINTLEDYHNEVKTATYILDEEYIAELEALYVKLVTSFPDNEFLRLSRVLLDDARQVLQEEKEEEEKESEFDNAFSNMFPELVAYYKGDAVTANIVANENAHAIIYGDGKENQKE